MKTAGLKGFKIGIIYSIYIWVGAPPCPPGNEVPDYSTLQKPAMWRRLQESGCLSGRKVVSEVEGWKHHLGGNPKIGGVSPKMDGENHGKPY